MSFISLITVASCVRPWSISNGRVSGKDFGHGKTVSYRCDGNYTLEGRSTLTCDDGRWNSNPPVCRGQSEGKSSLIVTHLTVRSLRIPVSTEAERGKSSLVAQQLHIWQIAAFEYPLLREHRRGRYQCKKAQKLEQKQLFISILSFVSQHRVVTLDILNVETEVVETFLTGKQSHMNVLIRPTVQWEILD